MKAYPPPGRNRGGAVVWCGASWGKRAYAADEDLGLAGTVVPLVARGADPGIVAVAGIQLDESARVERLHDPDAGAVPRGVGVHWQRHGAVSMVPERSCSGLSTSGAYPPTR